MRPREGKVSCVHGWGREASLAGHLCEYLQSRAWSPEGQLCLPCFLHSIPQSVILTPISLSGDHPHPPACTIFSLLGTGLHFLKSVIWGRGDGIIGEKGFFFFFFINCKLVI